MEREIGDCASVEFSEETAQLFDGAIFVAEEGNHSHDLANVEYFQRILPPFRKRINLVISVVKSARGFSILLGHAQLCFCPAIINRRINQRWYVLSVNEHVCVP